MVIFHCYVSSPEGIPKEETMHIIIFQYNVSQLVGLSCQVDLSIDDHPLADDAGRQDKSYNSEDSKRSIRGKS